MTGTTFDTVLADLVLRDVSGIDADAGYASALKNATVPAEDIRVGRKGLHPGIFRGYIDTDTPEGMSWTLDNAINDWAVAQLAGSLRDGGRSGRDDEDLAAEREYFARRASGYRHVFDATRGFFIGRTPAGDWRVGDEFDPDEWGHDYTETNAWGTAFTVPHDGRGLVDLYGGETAFGAALDAFFSRAETGHASKSGSYGFAIHEMTEARDVRMGMLGLSNQPAHHIPFMYMFAGRHDDAHRIIQEARARLFVGSDIGQGYPGDEDNGEMSAWYVFATIGLYPLAPASASYVLVPPAVRRTELSPIGGRPIVIDVVDGEPGDGYIRALRVNGAPWHSISVPHAVLAAGARIEFDLSSTPTGWAADSRPVSMSDLHGFTDSLVDATSRDAGRVRSTVAGAAALFDDIGATTVSLRAGDVVDYQFRRPVDLSLSTVTSAISGEASWRVEYRDASGAAVGEESRTREQFPWQRQTRPFRTRPGVMRAVSVVRFTALSPCELLQLEFFPADRAHSTTADGSDLIDTPTEGSHA